MTSSHRISCLLVLLQGGEMHPTSVLNSGMLFPLHIPLCFGASWSRCLGQADLLFHISKIPWKKARSRRALYFCKPLRVTTLIEHGWETPGDALCSLWDIYGRSKQVKLC